MATEVANEWKMSSKRVVMEVVTEVAMPWIFGGRPRFERNASRALPFAV
jgi:hypothetical protein